MTSRRCQFILVAALSLTALYAKANHRKSTSRPASAPDQPLLAATPPMGWNSWNSYGSTIDEPHVKANAEWMAQHLKSYGWRYVVIDMGWFITHPSAYGNSKNSQFVMDANGRFTPELDRYPSAANAAGFKPLADYIHSLGLKFGIHILRGIPKQAVEKNLPIAGSAYHAADAADTSDSCPWNPDNFSLDPQKPAAQAYYDSIAQLYAGWGVDFVKVDCVASHPYKGEEIRMLSQALRKTGRRIVLSLSPGAAPIEKIDELRQYSQMWRISDDIWDIWHSTVDYPQGLGDQFPRAAKWASLTQPGHWPDADMLPLGHLGPAPGWGDPRDTRLTHDEQRTLITLWSIFRSPLMMGGDLPSADAWTTSLLTNPEVIAVDQHSTANHPLVSTDKAAVWLAQPDSGEGAYIAIFNLAETPQTFHYAWKDLTLTATKYSLRDLWKHKDLTASESLSVTLQPHASILYRLTPANP
jgi:alpha-galactosidase